MHEFRIWAPYARHLAVVVGSASYPMVGPDEYGWWSVSVERAGPGTDYGFLVDDDKKVYPDPRSQWQPNGVHGSSRVYDQAAFAWSDEGWDATPIERSVVYELHIGTFTPGGTFDA